MRAPFAPTVLLGLASGVGAAVFSGRELAAGEKTVEGLSAGTAVGTLPLAQALALVTLAAWGVVLVTRGAVRRVVAALAVLAAGGTLAVLVLGAGSAVAEVRARLEQLGMAGEQAALTPAYWASVAAAVVCLVAAVLAVASVPTWPEMGRRYDAPTGPAAPADPRSSEPVDLWRAIDEGVDPTEGPTP